MRSDEIIRKLRSQLKDSPPLPGHGQTAARHVKLWDAGLEDLSYARLAEAHWDAVAILAECGRQPKPDALYGVWASELPGHALRLDTDNGATTISGNKMFCSGAGLLDYALITIGFPEKLLLEVNLCDSRSSISVDTSGWVTSAFRETQTGTVSFTSHPVDSQDVLGNADWYVDRPGFWYGALGPAACWAGGAEALVQYAKANRRHDAHTLAHLGAMHASIWTMRACLEAAAHEIDAGPADYEAAHTRA